MSHIARLIGFPALCLCALLAGCGGGGGGAPPPPSGGSNWDQMVWDQDNWG